MSGRWLLDTNAVSAAAINSSEDLDLHLVEHAGRLCTSSICYGEICFGLARRPQMSKLRDILARFLLELEILPWTEACAELYGTIRADMERSGKSLSSLDMLIAAHALEAGATLVTSDGAFRHVPGLTVEDWMA